MATMANRCSGVSSEWAWSRSANRPDRADSYDWTCLTSFVRR